MSTRLNAFIVAAGVGLASYAGLAGCVVNEPESPTRGVVVSGPPPAPVREERPTPPSTVGLGLGYWHWTGMQCGWIPGDRRPRQQQQQRNAALSAPSCRTR